MYEVDDPALRFFTLFPFDVSTGGRSSLQFFLLARDDPDIDETTRLRNRIAELESLVRELRGPCSYFVLSALSI